MAGVKEEAEAEPAGSPKEAPAAEPPADEKRLVLYGRTQASPGLSGLFRTARTEPMGERLRLVCDATHPGSGPEGTWSLDQMPVEGAASVCHCCHEAAVHDGLGVSCAQRLEAVAPYACSGGANTCPRNRCMFMSRMLQVCACVHALRGGCSWTPMCAEAEKLFAHAARMDLAQNVFKNGQWGRYLCGPFNQRSVLSQGRTM